VRQCRRLSDQILILAAIKKTRDELDAAETAANPSFVATMEVSSRLTQLYTLLDVEQLASVLTAAAATANTPQERRNYGCRQ
jgi:hypothetical protein